MSETFEPKRSFNATPMNEAAATSQPTFTEHRFSEFDIHPLVAKGIAAAGFEYCTPIQAGCLELLLAGHDVAGQAQTGTGKTAAFLIATFHALLKDSPPGEKPPRGPRAIILAPTRELAIQIHKDAELLGRFTDLSLTLAYGGVDYDKQRQRLAAGVDILIGTPGRIIDYFKQRVFDLRRIRVLVLDEADRMFDLGFIKDIRYLLRRMPTPEKRLNLLFSATLSYRVTELAYEHMNNPERVEVEAEQVTAESVKQRVYFPANVEKIRLLIGLLKRMDVTRTMVFCNTKVVTEKVTAYLKGNGFNAEVLSGDVRQSRRQTLLRDFHNGKIAILVATDVAARGLHIPDVSHVFNFDLPQDPEDYVHRIGRTARLGEAGEAISFACEDTAFSLPEIEEFIDLKLPVLPVEPELLAELQRPAPRPRRSGSRGRDAAGPRDRSRGGGDRPRRSRGRGRGRKPAARKR